MPTTTLLTVQIKFMADYLENEYGERATNGDFHVKMDLERQVQELEERLATQKAKEQAEDADRGDLNSEDETDEDVSSFFNVR